MIQPIGNNVLVKCFEGRDQSDGGIFVPDSCKKESNKVQIIAVGPGRNGKKMTLKPDDIGYRVKDWGHEVVENGIKYYIMDASAIIAQN